MTSEERYENLQARMRAVGTDMSVVGFHRKLEPGTYAMDVTVFKSSDTLEGSLDIIEAYVLGRERERRASIAAVVANQLAVKDAPRYGDDGAQP